ncbi:MAG: tetratricopeptide repeat protein, partial [Rhodospirillales bacterium]
TISTSPTSQVKHFYAGNKVVVDVMAPGTRKADPADVAEAKASARKKAAAQSPAQAAAKQGPKPIPLIPEPAAAQAGTPGKAAAKSASDAGAPQTKPAKQAGPAAVTVQATAAAVGSGKGVQLRFNWDEPVAAAVFRRAGYLWAIFDKPSPVAIDTLRKAGGNVLKSIEQRPAQGATILRMETVAGINPSLKRDGLAWILDFRKQPLRPQVPIELKPQPNSPVGARLFVPVPEPGEAIVVNDPLVGDNLVVVPVIPLGHGVLQNHRYVQAMVLPSAQGVVVEPLIDDMRVRALRQGVEVTSQSRFDLTPVAAAAAVAAAEDKGGVIRELTRAMDLNRWRSSTIETMRADRQKQQLAVATAKGQSLKEEARLGLARLFLAHGFAAEALAVLQRIREDRPAVKAEPEYNLMDGIANYLMGRLPEAKAAFADQSLNDNDEGKFWRAVLLDNEGKVVEAASDLKRLGAIIRPYPNRLKIPLSLRIVL